MEICQTSNCDNSAIAICLHCNGLLCVEHLLHHNEQLISEANVYCDEFNQLTEQIEQLSFDARFISAEEDLHDWLNDQMKQLDKVYEEKLYELKQAHAEVTEKVKNFQQIQRRKIIDIRRLFNSKLNKQISLEQLHRMKTTVTQLREDLHQFQTNQCSITLVNHDQTNYSYKPNINIQMKEETAPEQEEQDASRKSLDQISLECDKSKQFQLNVNAAPFEYIPKEQDPDSVSSIRQKQFNDRLFDGCGLFGSKK